MEAYQRQMHQAQETYVLEPIVSQTDRRGVRWDGNAWHLAFYVPRSSCKTDNACFSVAPERCSHHFAL
jgi:hypothetical protein